MKYQTGDIVRFKYGKGKKDGLHEITDVYQNKIYDYSITNDECNSEDYAFHSDLIFVCSVQDRKDI
jgi:hypothetical protein